MVEAQLSCGVWDIFASKAAGPEQCEAEPCLTALVGYEACMAVGRGQRHRHLRDGRDGNNPASGVVLAQRERCYPGLI